MDRIFIVPSQDRDNHIAENTSLRRLIDWRITDVDLRATDGNIWKHRSYPYYRCWYNELDIVLRELQLVTTLDDQEKAECKFVEILVRFINKVPGLGPNDNVLAAVHFGGRSNQEYRELATRINSIINKYSHGYGSLRVTYYSTNDQNDIFSKNRYSYIKLFLNEEAHLTANVAEFNKFIDLLKARGSGEEKVYFDERRNLSKLHSAILPIMIDCVGLKAVHNRGEGFLEKSAGYFADAIGTIRAANLRDVKILLQTIGPCIDVIRPKLKTLLEILSLSDDQQLDIERVRNVLDIYDAIWQMWPNIENWQK